MKTDAGAAKLLSIGVATLAGWNIALLTWVVLAAVAAALMSQVGYMGGVNKLLFVLIVLLALSVGVVAGRKLYPRALVLGFKWRVGWFLILLLVTVLSLPRPFVYFVN